MVIPSIEEQSIKHLISSTFPSLEDRGHDRADIVNMALLAATNEVVEKLIVEVITSFTREERTYYFFDSVLDDVQYLNQHETLHAFSPGGLPPHKLTLKVGYPIVLLQNLDPKVGLCKGTRLICLVLHSNFSRLKLQHVNLAVPECSYQEYLSNQKKIRGCLIALFENNFYKIKVCSNY